MVPFNRGPEHWAIYVRVSTRHQAEEGFSLRDQRAQLSAYAQDRGWKYQVFEDAGESGEKLEERPALVQLLELADVGQIEGVLVADESRLARDELIAALIRDRLKRTGTKLATLRGELDLTDPSKSSSISWRGRRRGSFEISPTRTSSTFWVGLSKRPMKRRRL